MRTKVTIVGGGASGLMAAVWAARAGAQVQVLEHMDRVGKKILSTGNGKCNMTNLCQSPECYRCSQPEFPMDVISRFDTERTLEFFREAGIYPKIRQGYVYPNSEQASSVLDALRIEVQAAGAEIRCGCQVDRIRPSEKGAGFRLETSQGELLADKVILAAGSQAAPATGSDGSGYRLARELGHRIIRPLPALVQLRCEGKVFKQLAGIRTEAQLTLIVDGAAEVSERGELQLTDYDISGIPTFQISRFAAVALDRKQRVTVQIDFLPQLSTEEAEDYLKLRQKQLSGRNGEDFLTGLLNKKLAAVLMKQAGLPWTSPVRSGDRAGWERLLRLMKSWEVQVTATNPFANAQVCCGGVDTAQIDPVTMESRLVNGLYLAGELLDVDGICGGYNLQWAWSSGALAGIHAGGNL